MMEIDRDKFKEEIRKFLKEKIGDTDFHIILVWRGEQEGGMLKMHSFSDTNMDATKTPFNIFKSVILTMFDTAMKVQQNVFGSNLMQDKPKTIMDNNNEIYR